MGAMEMVAECKGTNSLSTRVNDEMDEYLDDETDRVGTSRAEYIRRLLELVRDSQRNELRCPECDHVLIIDLQE